MARTMPTSMRYLVYLKNRGVSNLRVGILDPPPLRVVVLSGPFETARLPRSLPIGAVVDQKTGAECLLGRPGSLFRLSQTYLDSRHSL